VDARRVMRLVKKPGREEQRNENGSQGNYAALFETDDASQASALARVDANPLEQMNMIVTEMIAAANGEDLVRAWARRLSHILEQIQTMCRDAENKKRSASELQERLL
jgi:chemotaxis protein histidine kinase CheA